MAGQGDQTEPISLFYSYSHKDEVLRLKLETHLAVLRRAGMIAEWHDRKIEAGDDWKGQIDRHLTSADIVLLLVSSDFIASDYCWGEEMTKALERHERGEARVIPVILRHCRWQSTPLARLQAIPKEAKPIRSWLDEDEAFDDVVAAIERTVQTAHQRVEEARRRSEKQQRQQAQAETKRRSVRAEAQARRAEVSRQGDEEQPRPTKRRPGGTEQQRGPSLQRGSSERKPGEVFRDIEALWCPELVVIRAGSFIMGSPATEKGRRPDEGPQHQVTFAEPYALGRYPVTFEEYDHFCAETKRKKPFDENWGRDRRPAINVSWGDAQAYCAWLSEKTGHCYRLPSEAEWEYACRAGTTTPFWTGETISTEQANCEGDHRKRTTSVRFFKANPWGLHDMHGNVWEWCEDCWNGSYEGAPHNGGAWTGGDCSRRVLRGGAYYTPRGDLGSARRSCYATNGWARYFGFRVARTLSRSESAIA